MIKASVGVQVFEQYSGLGGDALSFAGAGEVSRKAYEATAALCGPGAGIPESLP